MTTIAWFDLLHMVKVNDVEKELTYRTDEISTNTTGGQKEWVMGKQEPGPQYQQQNGN